MSAYQDARDGQRWARIGIMLGVAGMIVSLAVAVLAWIHL